MKVRHISMSAVVLAIFALLAIGTADPPADEAISGVCWYDLDRNGVRDPGEPGLNGRVVELIDPASYEVIQTYVTTPMDLDGDGVIDPATETGAYRFTGISPGEYFVRWQGRGNWRTTTHPEKLFVLERSAELGQGDLDKRIFQRDPITGETINTIDLPDQYPPGEIAYGPGVVYYCQVTSPADFTLQIWELDAETGEILDHDTIPLPDEVGWMKYGTAYLAGKVYLLSGSADPEGASRLVEWNPETDEVTAILPAPAMGSSISLTGAQDMGVLLAVTSGVQGFSLANEVMKIDPATGQLIETVAIDEGAYSVGYHDGQILVANYNLWPASPFPHTLRLNAETGATIAGMPAEPASLHHCDKWGFAGDGVKDIQRVTVEPGETVGVDFGSYYCLPGDVNGDQFVGADDMDMVLMLWGQQAAYGEPADLSRDGRIGGDDLDALLVNWGKQFPIPGDVNYDDLVGGDDLDAVLSKWGQTVPPGDPADLDGDGLISAADLDIVLANWGQSAATTQDQSAVPVSEQSLKGRSASPGKGQARGRSAK